MNTLVIGVTGEKGGGKETFGNLLNVYITGDPRISGVRSVFSRHRFSDIINETLELWRLSTTRHNQQKLGTVMADAFGVHTLANAVEARLRRDAAIVVVLDGVRREIEERLVRGIPGSIMAYVTAPVDTRYERTRKRAERAGEREKTFEEFLEEEAAATEVEIPIIGSRADYRIDNTGTGEEFGLAVREFYEQRVIPKILS